MTRPLASLDPKWLGVLRPGSGEGFSFICPTCGPGHVLAVYFDNPVDGKPSAPWHPNKWHREGETFETLSLVGEANLNPSVQYPCWHGWIEDGYVIDVSEAPYVILTEDGQRVALSPRQSAQIRRVRTP